MPDSQNNEPQNLHNTEQEENKMPLSFIYVHNNKQDWFLCSVNIVARKVETNTIHGWHNDNIENFSYSEQQINLFLTTVFIYIDVFIFFK